VTVLSDEEPVRVPRVDKVGAATGPLELSSPLMTALESQGASFRLSLLLQMGDIDMALGHGDFLQGVEEFKPLTSRDQWRMLENEIFCLSSNCVLSSRNHVAHPISLLL